MQAICADRMKTASELLDHGILGEGAERLSTLHGCARGGGCGHWHRCASLAERIWSVREDAGKRQSPKH